MKHPVLASVTLVLTLAACGSGDSSQEPNSTRLQIVTTTTILGDVAANVAGDAADVDVLLPVGVDPHDYQPSSREIAALRQADLVIANGLGLEEGVLDVLANLASDGANVLEVGELIDPLPQRGSSPTDEQYDPHVWMDPLRMADAAGIIGARLTSLDPSIDWAANAEGYAARLRAADEEIMSILSVVDGRSRTLITNHDSLRYFAARYEFFVRGTIIPGGSTLGQPSSADLADLVGTLEELGIVVGAIFAETTEPTALAEAVAAEVGRDIAVVELYTGSLGEPGSGAESLIGMLTTNARRIADALEVSPF